MKITAITPTVNRPWCFSLLEKYMAGQTRKVDQWIVISDRELKGYTFTQGQYVSENFPILGLHSVNSNYASALDHVTGDAILCIEDDDYYAPTYVEQMEAWLNEADMVGVAPAYYYHIKGKRWRSLKNFDHCSLAATGFTRAAYPVFELGCWSKQTMPYIDMFIWAHQKTLGGSRKITMQSDSKPLHVGLKGCPGELGASRGHDPLQGHLDMDYRQLKRWLGKDADPYIQIRKRR